MFLNGATVCIDCFIIYDRIDIRDHLVKIFSKDEIDFFDTSFECSIVYIFDVDTKVSEFEKTIDISVTSECYSSDKIVDGEKNFRVQIFML